MRTKRLGPLLLGRMFDVVGHHKQPWLWIPGSARCAAPERRRTVLEMKVIKRTFQVLRKSPAAMPEFLVAQTLSPVIPGRAKRGPGIHNHRTRVGHAEIERAVFSCWRGCST